MSDRTTNPRQHDPSLCPSWCAGEHLHTASETTSSAFHHDVEQWSLLPAVQGLEGVDRYVYVTPSQFVPSAESRRRSRRSSISLSTAASRR